MLAKRLQRLPPQEILGFSFPVATGRRARLLGLAGLDRDVAGEGLLIPRCASVHTFGMRFALDLVFLDRRGLPLSVRLSLPPRRLAWQRGAAAVLELPAREGKVTAFNLQTARLPTHAEEPGEERLPGRSSHDR